MQVIVNYGKLGNKGRESITRFDGESAFVDAKKSFLKKVYDKKSEGYISREKMTKAINEFSLKEIKKEKEKRKKRYKTKYDTKTKCDLCQSPIKENVYKKINEWARGGGNWDNDKNFIGYKKVLCLDCQVEHDVFKKRVE